MKALTTTGLTELITKIKTALAGKVDKVNGKGLSTNDYDNTEKGNVALNTAARHSHSNKATLDEISSIEEGEEIDIESADTISIDSTPTASSNNLVTSGGVKAYVDEQGAAAANSIDLSLYDIYGKLWAGRTTANCYVVTRAGRYRFPLVYGNAIKKGTTNAASYTNGGGQYQAAFVNYKGVQITSPYIEDDTLTQAVDAELCLADANNIFTNVTLQTISGLKYVVFDVASVPVTGCNGILAVKDSNGDYMWSWHIWVWTDSLETVTITNHTNVNYDIMPVNLASTWGNSTKAHIKNWFYQFGRKDPMCPPAAYNSNTNATLYGSKTFGDTAADTVAEAIKRPYNFFKQYDTTYCNWNPLTYFYNFWDASLNITGASDNLATAVKTIYDPCPAGFTVPVGRAFTGFTASGGNTSESADFEVVGSFANGWYFKANEDDLVGQFFPASGHRNRGSGGLSNVGSNGYYWSSAAYSQTYAYGLDFGSGNVYAQDFHCRAGGFSVRPIREYWYTE